MLLDADRPLDEICIFSKSDKRRKLRPEGKTWPSRTTTDTFDRYDVPIGGITWHVKDGCFQKSLSAKQSS